VKVKYFGDYELPFALGEDKRVMASLAGARTILGAAGYWDDLGDLVVLRPGLVEVKMAFYDEDSWTDLDDTLDAAKKALFAERAYLKLAAGDGSGSAVRQAYARCLSFDEVWKYDTPRLLVASAKFELLQSHWDGLEENVVTDATGSFTADNSASTCQTSRTLKVRFYGPVNNLTTLTNSTLGLQLQVLPFNSHSGYYLEVDCGAMTAIYNEYDSDEWDHVRLPVTTQVGFMALAAASNSFTCSPVLTVQLRWYYSYL